MLTRMFRNFRNRGLRTQPTLMSVILNNSTFALPLTHTAAPTRGSITPTFTRATTETGQKYDEAGYLDFTALAGEMVFKGARRVANRFTKSENLTDAAWTKLTTTVTAGQTDPNGGSTAFRLEIVVGGGIYQSFGASGEVCTESWYVKSNTGASQNIRFNVGGSTSANIAVTTSWQRLQATATATGTIHAILGDGANAADILVWHPQSENVTGQTTQTASEYVSVGVPSDWAGSDLVTNGTFDTDTTGWTVGTGNSLEWQSGAAKCVRAIAGDKAYFGQGFPVVVGVKYVISAEVLSEGASTTARTYLGTEVGAGDIVIGPAAAFGQVVFEYTAGVTGTIYLWFYGTSAAAGNYIVIDNASVKPAAYHGSMVDGVKCYDTDRSGNPISTSGSYPLVGYVPWEARTNLWTNSENVSSWSDDGTTVLTNIALAPNGTLTADKMVETAANSNHGRYKSISITSGTVYTVTFYAKAGERDYVALNHNGTGGYATSYWNINTGVVQSSGAGHINSIELAANGLYRCISTFTAGVTGAIIFDVLASDTGARVTYTGDITKGIYLFGGMLEAGSFATPYQPTTTVAVARNASVLTYTGADVANIKTLAIGVTPRVAGLSDAFTVASLSGAAANKQIYFDKQNGVAYGTLYVRDTTDQAFVNIGTYTAGVKTKVAGRFSTNNFAGCINGGTVGMDTSGTKPTVTQLNVGTDIAASVFINSPVGPLYGWTSRELSDSELQAITS